MKNASPLGSLFGRILLAGLFLLSGLGKFPTWKETTKQIAEKGVPGANVALMGESLSGADVLLAGAVAFEIIGALSILIGFKARFGALLLLLFLAPVTYYFHDFWHYESGTEQHTAQLIGFMKNVAIAGGIMMILATGPGSFSVDRWLPKRKKE